MDAPSQWKISFATYSEPGEFCPYLIISAQKVTLDSDSVYVFHVDGIRMESSRYILEIERVEEDGE